MRLCLVLMAHGNLRLCPTCMACGKAGCPVNLLLREGMIVAWHCVFVLSCRALWAARAHVSGCCVTQSHMGFLYILCDKKASVCKAQAGRARSSSQIRRIHLHEQQIKTLHMCRYRLDADSPAAMRDHGQKDRRRQLEKAVSQGNKAVVKVTTLHIPCCDILLLNRAGE